MNYTGFAIIILVISLLTLAINTYLTRRVCSPFNILSKLMVLIILIEYTTIMGSD